jgi:excisionase family DNA binding protein
VSLDSLVTETMRTVLREEIRAALREHGAASADDLLTYDEAAAYAKVGKTTIKGWCKAGILPTHKRGRLVRVLRSDVLKAMTTNATPPPTTPDDWAAGKLAARTRRRGQ